MSKTIVGKKAPAFRGKASGGQSLSLSALKGQNVVLYFYPRDNTPGCTTEGQDFKAAYRKFRARNTVIVGVSRDSVESHDKFKAKFKFPFDLLADPGEKTCKAYDVIKEKNMYGKKVIGIERSTFLIDEKGVLRDEWRKVKVKGHADQVLDAVKAL